MKVFLKQVNNFDNILNIKLVLDRAIAHTSAYLAGMKQQITIDNK